MAEIAKGRPQGRKDYEALINEHATSGLTLKAFALSRGLNLGTLYAWHRQLRPKKGPVRPKVEFVSVDLVEPVEMASPAMDRAFEVVLRGDRVLRVHTGFDGDELLRLVSLLEASC